MTPLPTAQTRAGFTPVGFIKLFRYLETLTGTQQDKDGWVPKRRVHGCSGRTGGPAARDSSLKRLMPLQKRIQFGAHLPRVFHQGLWSSMRSEKPHPHHPGWQTAWMPQAGTG